jgi:AraC family L-rhamnose operon regulatory protein RhaS
MASRWTMAHESTWPGYVLALGTASADRFDPQDALGERLRLVLVDGGGGVLVRGGRDFPFHGPAAFCLDEREMVSFQGADLRYRLAFFHPSVLHPELTFETIRGEPRRNLPVAVSQDAYWLDPFVATQPGAHGVFQPGPLAWERIGRLYAQVHDERTLFRDHDWPCRTRSHLITLLIFLRGLDQARIEALTVAPADERMRELLAYLQTHFDQRLTVESLARRFATNRTTLQERFVAVTGRTIMDYVTALRIEVAQGLLRDTLVPVTEVGERTGYADAGSFSRAFRKAVGTAPSEYRERTNWMLRAG